MTRFRLPAIVRLATVVVALHSPSWLLQWLLLDRAADEWPLFNLDLLLAAIVACYSWVLGFVLVLGAWIGELVRVVAKNYHFLSVVDLLDAARFADLIRLRYFLTLPVIAGVLCLLVCLTVVVRLTRGRRPFALTLFATALVLQVADLANGSLSLFDLNNDQRQVGVNIAGSPVWNIVHDQRRSPLAGGLLRPFNGVVSYQTLREWHVAHPDRSVLLVLVESMGLPRDPGLRTWLTDQLATPTIKARWNVRATSEPFVGATTSGELRTLCGLQGHYSRLTDALGRHCLPAQMVAEGHEAVGLHGFHLRMFDRQDWWPRIGLSPWDGHPAGSEKALMDCNEAFRGICDATLLREAVRRAVAPNRLVYALTLDTHLPLPQGTELSPTLAARCDKAGTSPVACEMVARLGRVLGELEAELARSGAEPLVVVAGDHAPPFAELRNREAFEEGEVPVIILEPVR